MKEKLKTPRRLSGTREWAQQSCNIQVGCERNCRYCYARWNAVNRYKLCTLEGWRDPVISQSSVDKNFVQRPGVTMYPTTHDITERNISESMVVIRKLIESGNRVLVVVKPQYNLIALICETLKTSYGIDTLVTNFMFRFTIGSTDDNVLKFWEPGAADFKDRLMSLRYAFDAGFNTSVSVEPFLDPHPDYVYVATESYVTDDIWIGLLWAFDRRVVLDGVQEPELNRFVWPLKRMIKSEDAIWAIYNVLKDSPKVRWKDSIREVIEKGNGS